VTSQVADRGSLALSVLLPREAAEKPARHAPETGCILMARCARNAKRGAIINTAVFPAVFEKANPRVSRSI
jgi:hypothetical protein